MRLTSIILALFVLTGCGSIPSKVVDPSSRLILPIAQARNDLQAGNTQAVSKDLDNAETVAKQVSAEYVDCQQMRNEDDAFITKHKDDWTGARFQRLAKWFLWLGVPLLTLAGAALVYSGNVGVFVSIAHIGLGVLTLGAHFVTLLFAWIVRKFRGANKGTPAVAK